jgi:hypothetical protein
MNFTCRLNNTLLNFRKLISKIPSEQAFEFLKRGKSGVLQCVEADGR